MIAEATAVVPEGRISPADTGLWNDEQASAWRRITDFLRAHGAVPAIQLAHAAAKPPPQCPGKANTRPRNRRRLAYVSSPTSLSAVSPRPRALTTDEVAALPEHFAAAARRAETAGFDVVELHFATATWPTSSTRPSSATAPTATAAASTTGSGCCWRSPRPSAMWPAHRPLFARISATDWVEGGWTGDDSILPGLPLADRGVDLIDTSSGGAVPDARIPVRPGYQVPFARQIRTEARVPTGAVGLITARTSRRDHRLRISRRGPARSRLLRDPTGRCTPRRPAPRRQPLAETLRTRSPELTRHPLVGEQPQPLPTRGGDTALSRAPQTPGTLMQFTTVAVVLSPRRYGGLP